MRTQPQQSWLPIAPERRVRGQFSLASLNRRSEDVHVSPASVAELELGDRHKGQAFGNKPDRQGTDFTPRSLSHLLRPTCRLRSMF